MSEKKDNDDLAESTGQSEQSAQSVNAGQSSAEIAESAEGAEASDAGESTASQPLQDGGEETGPVTVEPLQADAETELESPEPVTESYYRIRFRQDGQHFTAKAIGEQFSQLVRDTLVMVQTEHGSEPARIVGFSPFHGFGVEQELAYTVEEVLAENEQDRLDGLAAAELHGFQVCSQLIEKHKLLMNLVRVEKFYNGSKIIFYFTADNRVDFRALVKDLVQEFRTRVEMRQVGVRHETKMIGGIGTCGRELCCASFIRNFDSVSIKMAKEQDLPLNPSKISGVCNRLLCCLTYEYETYRKKRKHMPKSGKKIRIGNETFLVKRQIPLQETIVVEDSKGDERILEKSVWSNFQPIKKEGQERRKEKKS